MKTIIVAFLITALSLTLVSTTLAGSHRDARPGGRKNQVREPEIAITDEVIIPGFWRPRTRNGYLWIAAQEDEEGRWHSGYWKPVNGDKIIGSNTTPGYWGPAHRTDYLWVNIEENIGDYPDGSWEKMNSYQINSESQKWVPGYWDGRRWRDGYWRMPAREGYVWIEGYYNLDGYWQEARWEPEEEVIAKEEELNAEQGMGSGE